MTPVRRATVAEYSLREFQRRLVGEYRWLTAVYGDEEYDLRLAHNQVVTQSHLEREALRDYIGPRLLGRVPTRRF